MITSPESCFRSSESNKRKPGAYRADTFLPYSADFQQKWQPKTVISPGPSPIWYLFDISASERTPREAKVFNVTTAIVDCFGARGSSAFVKRCAFFVIRCEMI